MNLKIHYPHQQTLDFIKAAGYPYEWPLHTFQDFAFVLAVYHKNKIAGYIWFTAVSDTYKILEIHVAIDKQYHCNWLTRNLFLQIKIIATLLDARGLLLVHEGWATEKRKRHAELLGFTVASPFAFMEIK